jgi:galactokinase
MTGGGFGGCTVNLVPAAAWERFESGVSTVYPAQTGRKPVIFRCQAVDGASIEQVG